MKIHFFPQTGTGKLAVGLAFLWPLFTILGSLAANRIYAGVESGNGIVEDLQVRPILAVTMLLGIFLGLVSLPVNLYAIFKKKERALLSFFSTLLGSLLIILLTGEIFIEH